MKLVGVDVGGTFTDVIFADTESGRTEIHKVPTTPDAVSYTHLTLPTKRIV